MATFSEAYVNYLSAGPFAGRTDPWAEAGRYFHQIHGCMISDLLERLRLPLLQFGYVAAREASLQIVERTQLDVTVRSRVTSPEPLLEWNYAEAATAVLAKPGIVLEESVPELEAINIRQRETGNLITIIEVISPSNKDMQADMELYQERRLRLVNEQGINVVELDLTRSVKRLVRDLLATAYSYHIALHLPHDSRFIGMNYGDPLNVLLCPCSSRLFR